MNSENLIYHYTTGQGLFGIINSEELYCTDVNFLNDPTETTYFDTLLNSILIEESHLNFICKSLYNDSYHDIFTRKNYVISFSKNEDSLNMWTYYAKGNGYNIGLDIDDIIKNNKSLCLKKIVLIYDEDEQRRIIKSFLESFVDDLDLMNEQYEIRNEAFKADNEELGYRTDNEIINYISKFNSAYNELSLQFKHPAFRNEEEVRLLSSIDVTSDFETKYRITDNGTIVEFVALKINLKTNVKFVTMHPLKAELQKQGLLNLMRSKGMKAEINLSTIPFREL